MSKKTESPKHGVIKCRYHELMPISELKPHPKNPNSHPRNQIEQYRLIMRENGVRQPVRVSTLSGYMTKGHGQLIAAAEEGWTHVPVEYQDYENADLEYADMVADNALATQAELDLGRVNAAVQDLGPDLDINLLGIRDFEIEPADKAGQCDEDEVPEPPKVARVKRGEIWQLGEHRLMCGDSTSAEDVAKLMNGEKADMVFTDPPYGMKLNTDYSKMPRGEKKYPSVIGDDRPFDPSSILEIPADRYCIWGADWFYSRMREGFSPIVWDKQPHHTVAGPQNHFELCWVYPSEKRRIVRHLWTGFTAKEKDEDRVHPTQKPIAVCIDIMERGGKNVLDLFGGSGSTLIACEKTGRRCLMMELDPGYVDVILDRWEAFTGQKAILLTDKPKKVKKRAD